MSQFKTKEIEKALCSKGFEVNKTHHRMLRLYVNGRKSNIRTKLSHGLKEYNDSLLGELRKQLKLDNKEQLKDLIKCPMSKEKYIELLTGKNLL